MGKVANKGYAMKQLDPIAHSTLLAIKEQTNFGKDQVKPILDQVHAEYADFRLELIDAEGKPIYDTAGQMKTYRFKELADRMLNLPTNLLTDGQDITLVNSADKDGQSYYLLMSLPKAAMTQGEVYVIIRSTKSLLSLIMPLLLSFSIPYFLSLWFFSSMNRRIRRLNARLNRVNINREGMELEDKSKDEIGQLTRHYNSMTRRIWIQITEIQQFENKRKLLLSNLSHDLRTPLTMILGYAETIRTGHYQDEQELQAGAKIILQRSRYMDRLLDQMLDVSRLDADDLEINLSTCNLSELIRKIAAEYFLILDDQGYSFEVDISEDELYVNIDAALIERAIRNLLDNAIRYGKDGNFLGIELVEDEQSVRIMVKDKGKGVTLEEQERIFERFYRVDSGRKGEGLGIGLSIVKDIIESHQGSVQMTSIPYVETVFQVRLPKKG
jgi:signal transduction histidine kinase